jgi:alkanesulfonate monooxygenase SsuD/methylene tetrahydromethanopterin reductase-like flavin-dependent oxidoreductase (luciferase family)
MKYGLDIPTAGEYADPHTLADLAAEAEEAGWDGFFLWDVLFAQGHMDTPVVDPWIALAAIATRTQRIRIGAFMTPLPRRRPWQVARQTVTLDHLSNGRLIFGAALGYQALDFTVFGEEFDLKHRAEKLDEGLAVLQGLWSGEVFRFQGTYYQVENARFLPKPLQTPRIPV